MQKHIYHPYRFLRRIFGVMTQPVFLSLAAIGNGLLLLAATAFYFAESAVNPKIHSFLDVVWWAVATATTVGYGDVTPVTTIGKWIGIVMMLFGATLFCSFTALFSSALMSGQLRAFGHEFKSLKGEIESELHQEDKVVEGHLMLIEQLVGEIRDLKRNKGNPIG